MDDFHWTTLHTWLSSGAGVVACGFFYRRIADIASGASSACGEFIFKHLPFLKPVPPKGTNAQMIKIARLKQELDDLTVTVNAVVKKLTKTEKRLEDCQGERAECRADLKNILFRVEVLEGKRKLGL